MTSNEPEPISIEQAAAEEVAEEKKVTKKRKRCFKLHNFQPEEGRKAPKGGGNYKSTSPSSAALKCANRWVVPKNEFEKEYTFFLREVGVEKDRCIYKFKVKRVKLPTPRKFKRGDSEITIDSKVVIV